MPKRSRDQANEDWVDIVEELYIPVSTYLRPLIKTFVDYRHYFRSLKSMPKSLFYTP